MEPFTLTNLLIGNALFGTNVASAVIGGILGNRADDFCCRAFRYIYERLKGGGRPVNHDLQRAVLRAYLHAQRIIAEECVRQLEPRLNLMVRPSDEVKWLRDKIANLRKQLAQVEKSEYVEPPLQALSEIELLVYQPNGNGVRDYADTLKQRLLNELVAEKGAPELYRQRLSDDFFPLVSALFYHELKHNEVVRAIFQSQMLAHLDLRLAEQQAQQTVNVDALMQEMQASLQATAELTDLSKAWFERLDGQLTELRQEMGAGFARMGVRFDEVMQRIVEGEFPKLLEEIRALRQQVEQKADRTQRLLARNAFLLGWDLLAILSPTSDHIGAARNIKATLKALNVAVQYPDPITQRDQYLATLHLTAQDILPQIRANHGDEIAGCFLLAYNTLITVGRPDELLSFSGILHALQLVSIPDDLRRELDQLMDRYKNGEIAETDRDPILEWANRVGHYFR